RDGKEVVFVIKGNRVELRSIRVGEELAGFFQVLEGLSGGESIATTGAEKLSDGDRVKIGS
ncbi:MAG TPA: hypothetical protein VFP47_02870, partial [Pyrinomonadaceae bacterium]|nr:hypothetical protein [Pyrinomonadaceae bacterium]